MGDRIKLLQIPKRTTAELQPLDVDFNRQYKKFVKRVTEKAIQESRVDDITNREGLMNLHSLIWNQFSSSEYEDMIRHAWHNTDPDYGVEELSSEPPGRMVQEVQFDFDPSDRCEFNCTNHAFIRCSHCGKLMCLQHFLQRSCFHNHSLTMDYDHHEDDSSHDSSNSTDSSHDELFKV